MRAHLGQLGWWTTTIRTSLTRRARLIRLECVSPDVVELEVTSADPFPVRDALVELYSGQTAVLLSRYPDNSDLHTLIFLLSPDQLASLSPDDETFVRYNPSNGQDTWLVGAVDPATAQGCE